MGKEKKTRNKHSKFNPIKINCAEQFVMGDEKVHDSVSNAVEMLQSVNSEQRECGCSNIADFVSEPGVIPQLLKLNVIKIMGPLMLDPSLNVRCAAVGAFRNLSVDGGEEICNEMIQADILTPLTALLKQYNIGWISHSSCKDQNRDQKSEVFINAVHLLWNLCEFCDTAVKIANQEDLLSLLVSCINPEKYGFSISLAAAQCVFTISENNKYAVTFLSSNMTPFEGLTQHGGDSTHEVLLRTLVAGMLYNIALEQEGISNTSGMLHSVIQTLSKTLSYDCTKYVDLAVIAVDTKNGTEASNEDESISDDAKYELKEQLEKQSHATDKAIEDIDNIASAHKVALEIITNLACTSSEGDDWEDVESDDSLGDQMDDIQDDTDDTMIHTKFEADIEEAIIEQDVISKVLNKCNVGILETAVCDKLSSISKGDQMLTSIESCTARALTCLGNLVTNFGEDVFGGTQAVEAIWVKLSNLLTNPKVVSNEELLDGLSTALRSLAQKLNGINPNQFREVTLSDLEILFEMGLKHSTPQLRANGVSIVSTIGSSLAKDNPPNALLLNVGNFLLKVISTDTELWVVAEALDAVFDVFAEDHINSVLVELSMITKLQQVFPLLKQRIKTERKFLGEHLPVILTVKANLARFIKYKQSVVS